MANFVASQLNANGDKKLLKSPAEMTDFSGKLSSLIPVILLFSNVPKNKLE